MHRKSVRRSAREDLAPPELIRGGRPIQTRYRLIIRSSQNTLIFSFQALTAWLRF